MAASSLVLPVVVGGAVAVPDISSVYDGEWGWSCSTTKAEDTTRSNAQEDGCEGVNDSDSRSR